MSPFKVLLWFLAFYFFYIIETSFLPFFQIKGAMFDLTFLTVFILTSFYPQDKKVIYVFAAWAGFLLDTGLGAPIFGAFTITCLLLVYFLKKINLIIQETNFIPLTISFIISFIFFEFVPGLITSLFVSIQDKKATFLGNFYFYNLLFSFIFDILLLFLYAFFRKKSKQRS